MSRLNSDLFNYKSKYEENGVLKNKLGITNNEDLEKVERMSTSYKLAKLYLDPGKQTFDINHYLSIHKYLFEDIYEFAGKTRNENITKIIPFCLPQFIYSSLDDTLKRAKKEYKKITNKDELLVFFTKLYADLDVIHPFREGNGRTEREYLRQFMDYVCKKNNLKEYYLDYSKVNREKYINAVVKADNCQYDDLLEIFSSILKVKSKKKNKTLKKDKL